MVHDIEPRNSIEQQLCDHATEHCIPIYGILELTPLCNMNCPMCFVRLSPEELQRQGRLRTAEEWLSFGGDMQKAGVLFILLTGGEPLLHPGFKEIYLGLRKLGMILTVNSNGTLLDENWADFFGKYKPRRINITLYGTSSETYGTLCRNPDGFEKAKQAIRLLRERGVDVKVNGSIVPANQEEGPEIYRIARSLDAACRVDTYMYPASRERSLAFDQQSRLSPIEAAEARVKQMKAERSPEEFRNAALEFLYIATHTEPGEHVPGSVRCRAGRSTFTINWQGEMRPCVMLTKPAIPIFETTFDSAWKQIADEIAKLTLSPKCNACTLRQVCNTCAACAKAETGSFDGVPRYVCNYTQKTLSLLAKELSLPMFQQDDNHEN